MILYLETRGRCMLRMMSTIMNWTGVCVNGKFTWLPVKMTRFCVKYAASDHDSESIS